MVTTSRQSTRGRQGSRVPLLILIVAAFGLCGAGGTLGAFAVFGPWSGSTPESRGVTQDYLRDLKAGRYDAAYVRLCTSVTETLTRQQFAEQMSRRPRIVEYKVIKVTVHKVDGNTTGSVSVVLTLADGTTQHRTIDLVEEQRDWSVCSAP